MTTAKDLAVASLTKVKAGDRNGWLALFEEDGVVQDPVGKSAFDPEGKGHQGKAAIAKFYDDIIAKNKECDSEIHRSILCGDEAAVYVTLKITMANGQKFEVEAINIYKQSKNGKIASLRSFWEM